LLLQQLQAQLQRSKRQLNQADADLSVGQKQLMSFGNTLRQAMMEAGPEAKGLHPFVKVAQRYAGTPYVWGGESGRGFDCSGFIIRVMRDLGYRSLPHSAAEQFNYGTPIAQALLKRATSFSSPIRISRAFLTLAFTWGVAALSMPPAPGWERLFLRWTHPNIKRNTPVHAVW
jgi:hypothetical protein